ncbi:MAG TPA: hypothetical protein VK714_10865 [Myxococcota bacterium]|nr:hypothetical protein [Myxococcota bacterium]
MEARRHYDWPGNVRELRDSIERAGVLSRTDVIARSDWTDRVLRPPYASLRLAAFHN